MTQRHGKSIRQLQLRRMFATVRPNCAALLVEFANIFATHGFDIGLNEEFMIKLTTEADSLGYSQNLPTSNILKGYKHEELVLLHRYDMVTTLLFSKYASPIFYCYFYSS